MVIVTVCDVSGRQELGHGQLPSSHRTELYCNDDNIMLDICIFRFHEPTWVLDPRAGQGMHCFHCKTVNIIVNLPSFV